jgi:uncharacterized membrane protein
MRGSMALAAIAVAARNGSLDVGGRFPGRLLATKLAMPLLLLAVGGELIGDKLPTTPSRLMPGPLIGRCLTGAFTGAIIGRGRGGAAIGGAAAGALAALASSWVGNKGRAAIVDRTGLPDPVVALGEDVLAILFGAMAISDPEAMTAPDSLAATSPAPTP